MRIRPLKFIAGTGVAALLTVGTLGAAVATPAFASSSATKVELAAKKSAKITIKGFSFKPGKLTVKVGQKIVVTNNDSTPHTVTADKGAFDTKDIKGGKSATFTVKKAGSYPYHCEIHQYMKGTLVVKK